MIAPAARYLQVASRKPLETESQPFDQVDRALIAGLYVGLEPVQAQLLERVLDRQREALAHQSRTRQRFQRIVAEVGRLKVAANDFIDVHDTGDTA